MPFGMVAASNILITNNFGFNGRLKNDEIYGADGFIDYGERGYDPRRAQWLSVDGAADEYPDLTPYAFTDNNPIHNHEIDGNFIESAWDAISLGMGVASFVDNVSKGNYLDATLDAVGIVADGAALITPLVPGGAGAGIKALRGGVKVADKINDASKIATTTKKAAVVTKTATTTVVKTTVKTAEKKVVAKVVTKTPAKKVVANTKGVVPPKKVITPKADEGVIYKVDGSKTASGKPYVGSADDLAKRNKTAKDGRDRTDAEIIGTYKKGDKDGRRIAEQKGINANGKPKSTLDNKRNEVKEKEWQAKGIQPKNNK